MVIYAHTTTWRAPLPIPQSAAGQAAEAAAAETCLDRAQKITKERGDNRGHPIDNITRYAAILEGIFGHPVTLTQAALALMGIKIAREAGRHGRDNVDDMAGYAWVIEAVQKEEGTW